MLGMSFKTIIFGIAHGRYNTHGEYVRYRTIQGDLLKESDMITHKTNFIEPFFIPITITSARIRFFQKFDWSI